MSSGAPSPPLPPHFVLGGAECLGEEANLFDCALSPWGGHACGGDILGLHCYDVPTSQV